MSPPLVDFSTFGGEHQCGYMRRRSRSIYPGMLLYAFWNALVLLGELPAD